MALVLKWPDGASRSGVLGGNGDESFFFLVCVGGCFSWNLDTECLNQSIELTQLASTNSHYNYPYYIALL